MSSATSSLSRSSTRTRSIALALAALTLGACGDRSPRVTPANAPVAASSPTAASPGPTPATPNPSSARRTPAPSADTLAAVHRAIADGRRLSRAGSHAEATSAFERALALDPGSPRIRCEAGYIAYLAGNLEVAEPYLTAALRSFGDVDDVHDVPARLRIPTAMCLYNAGLVLEARDRKQAAREAYERSLALRENATVRARFQALDAGSRTPVARRRSATARDHANAYVCELGADMGDGTCRARRSESDDSTGTLVSFDERAPSGTAADGFTANLVIADGDFPIGYAHAAFLEVRFGDAVRVARVAEDYTTGFGGVSNELEIRRLAWTDVVPGGRPELVLETYVWNNDEDMGFCERSGGAERQLIVCGTDDGTLRCASVAIESTGYDETYAGCEDQGGPGPAIENTGFALAYAFEGGGLRLTRTPESPEDAPAEVARTRSIATWLASGSGSWPSDGSD